MPKKKRKTAVTGKFSANSEDIDRYLERRLAVEESNGQVNGKSRLSQTDSPYHLDKETVDLLNEDRIDTGG
jgi:hypothetical protein